MTEIMAGLHHLKVPMPSNNPLGCTNVYLLRSDDGYMLIDAGINTDDALKGLEKELAEAGVDFSDIKRIFITHAHPDHIGLAGKIKERSGAQILAHHKVKDNLHGFQGGRDEHMKRMEQWLKKHGVPPFDPSEMPGGPRGPQGTNRLGEHGSRRNAGPGNGEKSLQPPPFGNNAIPDVTFQGGETISVGDFNLKLFYTPGHDTTHLCLYEADKKVLFSGDHVLPVISPHVSMHDDSDINPLGDFIDSLNSVRDLDANIVLPGHERTFNNLRGRVDELLAHHDRRHDEILESLKSGSKTAYEISQEITWMPSVGGKKFMELSPWDRRSAVTESLAHLKVMELNERVTKSADDGTIRYRAG